jgi:hypothetical protein
MGRGAQRRARGRWLLAALIVGIVLVACALPALAQGELHCRQLRRSWVVLAGGMPVPPPPAVARRFL